MRIAAGGLDDQRVIDLLNVHVTRAQAETERGSSHALDVSALQAPEIRFWTIWDEDRLLGCGALKALSPVHGEVKSMHVAEAARRRGAGAALLRHIIFEARVRGFERLSLETGSWPYFAPAHALYARHGFVECGPFGDYRLDPNSIFMTLQLAISEPAQGDG